MEGVKGIVDDPLVWDKEDGEHDARLKQVSTRAKEANLKVNAKLRNAKLKKTKFATLAM